MLLPNKLFSYKESTLSKLPIVLAYLAKSDYTVSQLYRTSSKDLNGVNEYIDVLDCLYALGKIEYDDEKEVLRYVV